VVGIVAAGMTVGASPAAAVGTIAVTPSSGLVDGQVLSITGAGWQPGALIGYCQGLPLDPPSVSNCDGGTADLINADAEGNFTASLSVARLINAPAAGGQVDCAAPEAPCVIGAAASSNIEGTAVLHPIEFAPAPPLITAGSASVLEGDSGTTSLTFRVTLSFASPDTVTAQWATLDSQDPAACSGGEPPADPASDYAPASGTVTFAPGDTSEDVTISVNGDTLVEPNECVIVELTNATNATFPTGGSARTGGTITNDDPLKVRPSYTASVVEGDSGTIDLDIPVTLSKPSPDTVTVQWGTFVNEGGSPDCQADPATDYTPTSGTVTFAPGDTNEAVTVSVNGDMLVEPDECVIVLFTNATNAVIGGYFGLGIATITNDDPVKVRPSVTGSVVEGDAGTSDLDIPVSLSRGTTATVTAQWEMFVNEGGPPACQADPATDFTPTSGTVTFTPGDTDEAVTVSVNGDTLVEPDECVIVLFTSATNAVIGGYFGLGIGTITNDDSAEV
jgi:hypothetical protein